MKRLPRAPQIPAAFVIENAKHTGKQELKAKMGLAVLVLESNVLGLLKFLVRPPLEDAPFIKRADVGSVIGFVEQLLLVKFS